MHFTPFFPTYGRVVTFLLDCNYIVSSGESASSEEMEAARVWGWVVRQLSIPPLVSGSDTIVTPNPTLRERGADEQKTMRLTPRRPWLRQGGDIEPILMNHGISSISGCNLFLYVLHLYREVYIHIACGIVCDCETTR